MHGGAVVFSSKGLAGFSHSASFCTFQFKCSDIRLCRREEGAPCFLWILFSK